MEHVQLAEFVYFLRVIAIAGEVGVYHKVGTLFDVAYVSFTWYKLMCIYAANTLARC
jgi:hypothetical protein